MDSLLRLAPAQQAGPKLARLALVLVLVLMAQLVAPPKPAVWLLQVLELEPESTAMMWLGCGPVQRKELPIPAGMVPLAGQKSTEPLAGKQRAQQTMS